jgi:hypothetical protein
LLNGYIAADAPAYVKVYRPQAANMRESLNPLMFLYHFHHGRYLSDAHSHIAPQIPVASDEESDVSDTMPYRAKEKREAAREDEEEEEEEKEQPALAADSDDDDDDEEGEE